MPPNRRSALTGTIALALLPNGAFGRNPPNLEAADWRADLDALYTGMQSHHRDLFHLTPKAQFDDEVARIRNAILTNGSFGNIVAFQCLVALAGDGHSFIVTRDRYRSYPFEASWTDEGVRIVRIVPALRNLLGARIDRVDGMQMAEVAHRLDRTIPQGENRWYVLGQRPDRMRRAELVAELGIARSSDRIRLEGADSQDRPFRLTITAAPLDFDDKRMTLKAGPSDPDAPWSDFGWSRIAGGRAVHLNFRRYDDLATRCAALFQDLAANPPEALLIDLRQNSGGNYSLPREHLIYPLQGLSRINREARLFVLIGRRTFSAAMTNATDFRRETEALLVGEPTGARPNGFQELSTFTLPRSQLRVACSARRYRFDSSDGEAVYPDISAKPTWKAMAAGQDSAIAAALERAGLA